MNTRTLLVTCALVAGCKDKQAGQHAPPPSPSGSAAADQPIVADPQWADKLPSVSGGDTQLLTQFAIGLVRIKADGSLAVASAPTTAPADARAAGTDPFAGGKVIQLGGLSDALGLPPVKPRTESVYGVIEEGSASGSAAAGNPTDVAFAQLGHPVAAVGAPAPPRRMTTAFALSHPNDVSGGVMVFAAADASATTLVDVLSYTGGFLAVRNAGKLGALPLQLDRHAPAPMAPTRTWLEVRLGSAIEIEMVPGTATQVASLDKLGEAVKATGATTVDLLVSQQTKVQDVVNAIEQLRAVKIEAIGIGAVPGQDGGTRGKAGGRIVMWDVFVPGVDAAAIGEYRKALEPVFAPMLTCYDAERGKTKAQVKGTTTIEIFVSADGKVQGAKSTLAKPLAGCLDEAFKAVPVTVPAAGAAAGKLTAKLAFLPT